MEFTLEVKEIGQNELQNQFEEISQFVQENWAVIFEGAIRLGLAIESDYYAPERVSIENDDREKLGLPLQDGQTRLNQYSLKYANGHKYNDLASPTENDLQVAATEIQFLIDEAAKPIKSKVKIEIVDK